MSISQKHMIFAEEKENVGWIGKFAVPGRPIQAVLDGEGRPEIFPNRHAAMASAGLVLCSVLNGTKVRQVFVPSTRRDAAEPMKIEAARVFARFGK